MSSSQPPAQHGAASQGPAGDDGLPAGMVLRAGVELSPKHARALLEAGRLLLVDCRTAPEWDIAHVAGSVHIPLAEIEQRADEVQPQAGQQVAVICHHGVRSLKAAFALRALGQPQAMSVAGGIELWSLTADPRVPRYVRDASGCSRVS